MKEIYAVVRRYKDRDNRIAYSRPEDDFYESREEAQKVADGKNAPLVAELAAKNSQEKKRVGLLNKEQEVLANAGLRKGWCTPLEAFVQTELEESYEVWEYDLHEVNDGT